MKDWALIYLRCETCGAQLTNESIRTAAGDTTEGILICDDVLCGAWYPIIRGIPRLVTENLRTELTAEFIDEHSNVLRFKGLLTDSEQRDDHLHQLKEHINKHFGFEWIEYSRFGWDDPVYNLQNAEEIFRAKSLLNNEALANKLVLDAGCGNGRYSYSAAKSGAQLFSLELGDGVDSTAENLAEFPNVQVVQGDIFHAPFADNTFDVIYSIGVLMHTGDARKATQRLASKLKIGGSMSVHVYGQGNPFYEYIDRTIRKRTIHLSAPELRRFYAKRLSYASMA